jgi:hypothetical protein
MPTDTTARDSKYDSSEGVPWQVIYAAFLGVTLCSFALYLGMYLANGQFSAAVTAAGVAVIVLSAALALCYAALLPGLWWAIIVCRISMPLFAAAALIAFVWGVIDAVGAITWRLSFGAVWDELIALAFIPNVILPLAATLLSTGMIWLLFCRVTRGYFGR